MARGALSGLSRAGSARSQPFALSLAAALLVAATPARCKAFAAPHTGGSDARGVPTVPTVPLRNGVSMPAIALGTPSCGFANPDACSQGTGVEVANGLAAGFTAVDTANHYNNQKGVAAGAAAASAKGHAAPWITSKVEACNTSFVRMGSCFNDTVAVARSNLAALNRSTLDLMLLHAPTATSGGSAVYPGPTFGQRACNCSAADACLAMQQQWAALEAMYDAGELRAIGVSNFCPSCLDCLSRTAKVMPHVNQILLHIGMGADPSGMVTECTSRGIVPQAYSALGSGSASVLSSPVAESVAKALNVSTAQVALRWLVQRGVPVIARTGPNQTAYMAEDLDIFTWALSDEQVASLSAWRMPQAPNPVKSMCLLP